MTLPDQSDSNYVMLELGLRDVDTDDPVPDSSWLELRVTRREAEGLIAIWKRHNGSNFRIDGKRVAPE